MTNTDKCEDWQAAGFASPAAYEHASACAWAVLVFVALAGIMLVVGLVT